MFFIVMQICAPERYGTDLRYHAELIGVLCANTDRQYVRGIGFIGGNVGTNWMPLLDSGTPCLAVVISRDLESRWQLFEQMARNV
jgi:hypothetical protein